jgi:hypothetical protein
MKRQDQHHTRETKTEPRPAKRESPAERTVAPPIEREHETSAGILEEDERREHERH